MHYLDHVFPLQFPLYQPSAVAGGRGWLLSMLAHTKPLHHAALSLAAYHRQSLFCPSIQDLQRGCLDTEALQQQRVITIRELRQHLEGVSWQPTKRSLIDNIDLLCCMALLISLEVSSMFLRFVLQRLTLVYLGLGRWYRKLENALVCSIKSCY
jgi:hypothetical protein